MLIRVLDLETTGTDVETHGVCEIGFADVTFNDGAWHAPADWVAELVNPGHPISPETSAIHHIVDEDVENARLFAETIRDALTPPRGEEIVALAAHGAKFERAWITEEMTGGLPWICTHRCSLRIWPSSPSHSNQALRYFRRPEGLNRENARSAHRAGPDAYVTSFHVRDLLQEATLEDLILWSSQPALQVTCRIGKWRGHPWREVDWGFLRWVSDRDFDEDVLFTVRHEMRRREKEYEAERRREADHSQSQEADGVPF